MSHGHANKRAVWYEKGEMNMGHRAKHRRANWVPERLRKAKACKRKEDKRQAEDAKRKAEQRD